MRRIHLSLPDEPLSRFLSEYLDVKGFSVTVSNSHVHAFTVCVKEPPDLIVMTKDSPLLDAVGFIIKKEHARAIEHVPLFLIGDFKPKEIAYFKEKNVKAFLSVKVNPSALNERLHQHFGIPLPAPQKRTPMLMDIHSKGKLLIVQLEGNLDPDKAVELNYLITRFLSEKAVKVPRIMFIIPSMYPDMINGRNMRILFKFLEAPGLKPDLSKIVVLSRVEAFLKALKAVPELEGVAVVPNYYEGYRALIADFDVETTVPVVMLKPDSRFFLDLYGPDGRVIVKAMEPVGQETLDLLAEARVPSLKYYGDLDLDRVSASDYNPQETSLFDYITRDFAPVSVELFDSNVLFEKQNLFFSRIRGQHLLFVSLDPALFLLVQQSLSVYFEIHNVRAGENLKPVLEDPRFAIIFIDLGIPKDTVLRMLHAIRTNASRRRTTIILMAKVLNKEDLVAYRGYGTDHVILQPFTTEKIFNKVYSAVTLDRGT